MTKPTTLIAVLLIALAALIGAGIALWRPPPEPPRADAVVGEAAIGGPFVLIDQDGAPVADADFRGRWMLVYFGFTFCPDVCPTDLQIMAQTLDELGANADKVAPIFVSVDPERDTPEQLKAHLALFDERIQGLTGTPEQIKAAAQAYKVYYAKAPLDGGGYSVDHSAFTYLMDPDGRFVEVFPHQTPASELAARIRQNMESRS